MPWTPADASRFTKKATSEKRKQQWAEVANRELGEHGDEGTAIRQANRAVREASYQGEMREPKR